MSSFEANHLLMPTSQSTTKFFQQPQPSNAHESNHMTHQQKMFTNVASNTAASNSVYETIAANGVRDQQIAEMKNKKNTGIITASSWRIGEAIAKKQLKQHLQQLQDNERRPQQSGFV